ncbi:MAG: hypothetical protein OYH77_04030 [Pseudomonadota bacterium]|nr:hypothetical protein [Pseudomonadota bacterium]
MGQLQMIRNSTLLLLTTALFGCLDNEGKEDANVVVAPSHLPQPISPMPTRTLTPQPVVADISFYGDEVSGNELMKYVGEEFEVNVLTGNLDFTNLAAEIDLGGSSSLDHLKVELYLIKSGNIVASTEDSSIYSKRFEDDWHLHGGSTTFRYVRFREECAQDCQLSAKLKFYRKEGCDAVGENCLIDIDTDIKPINVASKDIVIKKGFAVQARQVSGKKIEITVTKNNILQKHAYINVWATVPCAEWAYSNDGVLHLAHNYCVYPYGAGSIFHQGVRTDYMGAWSAELDADGSWEAASNKYAKGSSNYDLAGNMCHIDLYVSFSGQYASISTRLENGKCT